MKKIFTLMAAAIAVSASAQVQVLPVLNLGEGEIKGTIAAETVLVDDDNIKATTVWEANCGINNAEFSEVEASLGTLSSWIEMRVKDNPSAENPYGTLNGSQTPIVFSPKADMSLSVYVRTGNNKTLVMTNTADFTALDAQKKNAADPTSESNDFFFWTYDLKANNEYVLTEKGGTGRFYGFQYTVTTGTDPVEPGDDPVAGDGDVTVTWSMAKSYEVDVDGVLQTKYEYDFTPVISAEGLIAGEPVLGAEISWKEARGVNSVPFAIFNPSAKVTSATDGHTVSFSIETIEGYTFEPTGFEYKASVIGTDGGNYDLDYTWAGETKNLQSNFHPIRNKEENGWFSEVTLPITAVAASGKFDVTFSVYNLADNKQIGLSDVVIKGKLTTGTGVAEIATEGAAEYYNLQGVRVANPGKGLYIKRQGNKAVKVLVK